MDSERLSVKTVDDLTRVRAADFVRFAALQARFADDPNSFVLAQRNFLIEYPNSLSRPLFEKAAVAAGTTLDATFASPLSALRPLADAFLELVRPATLIGRIPGLRHVPFNVSVPLQTVGGTYGWIGEGAPAPVSESDFSTVSVGRSKVAGIIVLTDELVKMSSPSAVQVMQREMIEGTRRFLDAQFVDPAVAAVANVNPASITNGASSTASAGSTQANAATDFQALVSTFVAANPNVEHLVVLMTPSNGVALSRALGQPSLGLKGGTAFGVPVITSGAVGNRLIALDASQILVADEGAVDIDASRNPLVQMDSAPTDPSTSATVYLSLWQRNLVGIRVVRMVHWMRAAASAVHYISGASYV